MYLDDLKSATGDWVALLGFSQMAKIAASILYTQQLSREMAGHDAMMWPDFRFAILLAGRGPLVWLDRETRPSEGLADAVELSTSVAVSQPDWGLSRHILQVPTIHVHGSRDPGLELHRNFYRRHCTRDSSIPLELIRIIGFPSRPERSKRGQRFGGGNLFDGCQDWSIQLSCVVQVFLIMIFISSLNRLSSLNSTSKLVS